MPLQRSPPATSPAPTPALEVGPTLTEVCAPDICESDTASERGASRNVSVRHKRRHGDDDIKELKGLISSLSSKVDQSFHELKQKNEELKESLQFMSDKYDLILKTLQNLQEDRAEDKKTIQKLEEKIEFLERKSRSASLEIRNVPICLRDDRKFESKEDASLIVKTLSKAVEVDIQDCDIKDIYRIQTHNEGSKPIIVELNSVLKKDKIMQGVKNFNKNKPNGEKLNTGHLSIPGPAKPVFISEALTPNAQKLFYAARQFAKENGYTYCWTSRGSIFLRKAEDKGYFFSWRDPALRGVEEDWLSARNYCRQRCMDLVSLETSDENEWVKARIVQDKQKYIWTSGRLCDFKGCNRPDLIPNEINGWFWTAELQKLAPTTNRQQNDWSEGGGIGKPQPDNRELHQGGAAEHCVAILNNFYNDGVHWHDVACHHRKPFVCEENDALLKYVRYTNPNLRV